MRSLRGALQVAAMAFVLSLLGLLGWQLVVGRDEQQLAAAVARGERPQAPVFRLSRLDTGGTLSLAALRGKVVVVNFWASWCDPCKNEAPRLEAAWHKYRGRDVVFVGVNAQDFTASAHAFIRRFGLTYPNLRDGPGKTMAHYGVNGFPETWFVDRSGRLVGERIQGPVSDAALDRNIHLASRS